ncbi:hypothetical protein C3L33_05366, partial [Rhododendron williamsianum]
MAISSDRLTTGFTYACSECSGYFGISCTLEKSKPHEHPLVYFNIESKKLKCDSCRRYLLTPFFRYEDENAEFYCDICEEQRYLLDPTYYCEECHFVSHVHCAIVTSKEMYVLVEEWPMPFKLEEIKNADKQKGPALGSLARVDEATGVSVEECEAEGSRVAENSLSIFEQDEEIAVLLEKILHKETKLSAMHERKEELKRIRALNFGLTRTKGMMSKQISEQTRCSASESSSSANEQWI